MKGEHEGSEEIELKEERVNIVLRTFFSLIYYLVLILYSFSPVDKFFINSAPNFS